MSVLNENQLLGASGAGGDYEIEQSLRFNESSGSNLERTPAADSNRKTWTFSAWCKLGNLDARKVIFGARKDDSIPSYNYTSLYYESDGTFKLYSRISNVTQLYCITNAKFRDASAWYHIVAVIDTTQATASDRAKLYVNNELQSFSTATIPSQNYDTWVNNNFKHFIGSNPAYDNSTNHMYDGYLAEVNFIDGQALTPDSFGETGTYGEWKPKAYAGTYGTNGFYLKFENASSLGNDSAGSINWTPNNLAATDQMLDSPTNNFATINPLAKDSSVILQEGNLLFYRAANMTRPALSTIGLGSTQKWYCEFHERSGTNIYAGVQWEGTNVNTYPHAVGTYAYVANADGGYYQNGSYTSFNSSMTSGDKIRSIAYDAATGKMWIGANGTFSGNPAAGSGELLTVPSAYRHQMYFVGAKDNASATTAGIANFGQDSSFAGNKTAQGNQDANSVGDFYYAPPTGFLALCTANLPDPDVIPSEHFNTVLYTGNGANNHAITGVGFLADFVWTKSRSSSDSHTLQNSVAGVAQNMSSNGTQAEGANARLSSFDTDGFTLTNNTGANGGSKTFVAWNWKAGGSASSNTNGTITSSVSANAAAGFSIVSWTGTGANATVGHGLASAPELIIAKNRDRAVDWVVQETAVYGATRYLRLNTTNASSITSIIWNNTNPTSSVFSIGTYEYINANTEDIIAYCFHSVESYSKVGSYTGNGSTDGTFVHCGFRPAYVMVKRTDASGNGWAIKDDARFPSNVMNGYLFAESSGAEGTASSLDMDFTSNGFKWRGTSSDGNASGGTYIFLAFAENPFKFSNAR